MEFDYTSIIYIYEKDLEEDVYYDVMAWYDDGDYYNCHLIEDKVRKEIERRLG